MKKYFASTLLLILIVGCSTSHMEYIGKNNWAAGMSKSALTSGDLSYKTTYFLVKNALMNEYQEDHIKVMILLAKFIENPSDKIIPGENSPIEALCVLIELCAYEGRNSNGKDSIKFWLSGSYYSYKYLFDKKLNIIPSALNSLEIAAQIRFYNYSLSQIYSYFADNNISFEESHSFPLIIGSANLAPVRSDLLWSYSKFTGYINGWDYFPLNLQTHSYVSGLGVPILGLQDYVQGTNKNMAIISMVYPFTFLITYENFDIEKESIRATPKFFDSFKDEFTKIDDRKIPLSKDYSLALAKCVDSYNRISGIKFMFNPAAMAELQGLYFLSPYDPKKIPVIMTHGLMSTPGTWLEMLNTLLSNQTIRENYQFWLYTYPTGQPIFYSEFQFRTAIVEAHKEYDPESKNFDFNHMVLIGHSMGGILSRLAVQDSEGDKFAESVIGVNNLDELKLNDKEKAYLNNIGVFKPLPFVGCLILLASPNRGSDMATFTFSRIGSYFITLPVVITQESSSLIQKAAVVSGLIEDTNPIPTGIDSLKPNSKYLEESVNLPYKSNLEIHTIIGNQYAAGEKSGSDGVVPYSSAHLDNAVSELVVKSNHSVHQTPEAIKEVTRILLEYLKELKKTDKEI